MSRIAILTPGGVSEKNKGVKIPRLYNLVSLLSERFEITVYVLVTEGAEDTESFCGNAKVKVLRACYNDHWFKRLWQYVSSVLRDQRSHRFELVHGMFGLNAEFATVLLGKVLKLPTLVSLFGGETASIPTIQYGTLLHPLHRRLFSWVVTNATDLMVQTEFQVRQLRHHRITRDKIHVIPCGVDTTLFTPQGREDRLMAPYRLLHVANLLEVKDQVTLLKAFATISRSEDCILRIIGADYLNGKIQNVARALGIADRVEFLGWIEHSKLPEHYRWAHILLHTSLHESQAMVVAEAAACKTVVCGTRVGLLHDFGETKAVVVPTGDHEALATGVLRLIRNPREYAELQQRAYEWALHYDLTWTAGAYEQLYRTMLSTYLSSSKYAS
jgi:glycosyltransferase involved in cell wall biosynthesis